LLFLDEPFASVDPPTHLKMLGMLATWLQPDRSVVLVSHDPEADMGSFLSDDVTCSRFEISTHDA
jgi:ABC-type Mn2+/Zn2+ transport system ATPase subunit